MKNMTVKKKCNTGRDGQSAGDFLPALLEPVEEKTIALGTG